MFQNDRNNIGLAIRILLLALERIFGLPEHPPHRHPTLAATIGKAALRFKDPNGGTLLEVRVGPAAQTVFPPSIHESGEPIMWEENGEPAEAGDDLVLFAQRVAALSVLARHWPPKPAPNEGGGRHDAALTVGGFLARCGFDTPTVKLCVEWIARAAQDDEWPDRRKAGEDTATDYQKGAKTYGYPTLKGVFGDKIAETVAEWLGFTGSKTDEPPERTDVPDLGEWDAGDDVELPPPREWLLANQFCRCFLSGLLAPGSTGKTALRVLQFMSLATGKALTGQHVFKRSRVLVVSLEDDKQELRRRIAAARLHYNIEPSRAERLALLCRPQGLQACGDAQGRPPYRHA